MNLPLFTKRRETECTIEIEHSDHALFAHVELDGEPELQPGDRVCVHGEPIRVAFGDRLTLRRPATVLRAGVLERQWTRLMSRLDLADLTEVSFTSRRLL